MTKKLIRYCKASYSVGFFRNSKTEYNYFNVLSIITTLLSSTSRRRFLCRRLIVVVGVSFASAESFCHRRCGLLVVFVGVSFSLACCRLFCIIHGSGGVPPRGWFIQLCRIVAVVVISVFSSPLAMCCSWGRRRRSFCWIILSDLAPRCSCHFWRLSVAICVSLSSAASLFCCRRRLLVFVVVSGVLSLSVFLSAASRRSLKILVYIRITTHATTMEPQHQVQNGPDAILDLWRLNIVWTSPQSKITYHFVPKSQQVIGTNRELFERFLALLFS